MLYFLITSILAVQIHSHGLAEFEVIYQNHKLLIEMKAASFGFLGFEDAKSNKQKQNKVEALRMAWFQNAFFENDCKVENGEFDLIQQGADHAEIVAKLALSCPKKLDSLQIDLSRYTHIKQIQVRNNLNHKVLNRRENKLSFSF